MAALTDVFMKEAGKQTAILLTRVLTRTGGKDWWQTTVLAKLSHDQQRRYTRAKTADLTGLDIAAILRILDKNWDDVAQEEGFLQDHRTLVRELLDIRHRHAHEGTAARLTDEDQYRELDTLKRYFSLLKADRDTMSRVDEERRKVLALLATPSAGQQDPSTQQTATPRPIEVLIPPPQVTPSLTTAKQTTPTLKQVSAQPPPETLTKDDHRHKAETEYHLSSVKLAVEADADLTFVRTSLHSSKWDATSLPDNIKDFAATHLEHGYVVFLDCSHYKKPLADIKAGVDAFLADTPSHTVGSYLLWMFGQTRITSTPTADPKKHTLTAETDLPIWLDRFIYEENNAPYEPDRRKVQKNLDATPEDVRWYLGTYFPRSYAELFCITDSFLERLNVICGLPNDGKMSILDVGCGSGGALTGILWAIRRQRHDLPHISITAIDGNATAMATLTSIVDRTRQCWRSTDIKLQTYTEEITTTFPTKMLTGKMFDIIVTSKLLCELSTSGEDAYSGFLKAYAPYLAEQGILLILDVPTKTDTESNYNPNRMLTATNDFVRSSQNAFGTVLPLPCATNGQTCRQGCFMTRTFAVRTSRNARIESDVCFTVIARKSLADKLLAFVAPERRGTQCRPFPDPSKGEEQVTPQDPFCL